MGAILVMYHYVRDPDPGGPDAKGSWEDYRFDMPLAPNGRVLVSYTAHSPMGVSRANLRYRVIPKGEQVNRSGDDVKVPQHPRDDPNAETFRRHVLKRVTPDLEKTGKFVRQMGLFEKSGKYGAVEFYAEPSPNPDAEPGELFAGGRDHFEIAGLEKPPSCRMNVDTRRYTPRACLGATPEPSTAIEPDTVPPATLANKNAPT